MTTELQDKAVEAVISSMGGPYGPRMTIRAMSRPHLLGYARIALSDAKMLVSDAQLEDVVSQLVEWARGDAV